MLDRNPQNNDNDNNNNNNNKTHCFQKLNGISNIKCDPNVDTTWRLKTKAITFDTKIET